MTMRPTLSLQLCSALRKACDPARAAGMQRYMKSAMPYLGVSVPVARRVFRKILAPLQFENSDEWKATVLAIWHNAKYREEWYGAVELCGYRNCAEFQTPDALALYEELIVSGAWWDIVDTLASHRVGGLLRNYPAPIARKMRTWSRSTDMWKRRTSILCQLGFKHGTDLKLLYDCIEPSLESREFFLRKAIGWALRQYAWTDPKEVRRYVEANANRLSPLSRREAIKNI